MTAAPTPHPSEPASALPPAIARGLCAVAFASGCAALVFETLWFRTAGLAFGNGIWASSLVLASFMTGLALGNGLAAGLADRLARPIRFYALLELAIGVTGVVLVVGLPRLAEALAPLHRALLDHPVWLNGFRSTLSFVLMTVPATAMGATLPVLVKALARSGRPFGEVLGRLYGWNTLGAVLGAVLGEALLIGWLGVRGSALAAGAIDAAVAVAALALARRVEGGAAPAAAVRAPDRRRARATRLLAAAFLSGGVFLALEVVWFRFLSLFVYGTSLVFAVLLAVVLAGISLGGLAAGRWIGRGGDPEAALPSCALVAAVSVLGTYAIYPSVVDSLLSPGHAAAVILHVLVISIPLMAPTALLSGALFAMLGAAARRSLEGDARTTGLLTLANTIGGAIGSLLGGFVLLPRLGVERALWLGAAIYVVVALLAWSRASGRIRASRALLAATAAAAFWIFPFGALRDVYLPHPTRPFLEPGSEIVAVREGVLETLVFMRTARFGRPLHYRMFTDGFSMSATTVHSRRYMKDYVYLPAAIHPDLRRALLISYGVGSTAKALTDTASLERIDVVDISPDILDMSRVVFPSPRDNPLLDPRVETHVEDGRFYLQTVEREYDLITSEPPPPKYAGVVNLYSREYFELVRRRLAPGGLTTYWLPVHGLSADDARSILRAFCDVFDDCTLWTGAGLDWMMVGSRDARGGVSEAHFRRQWEDPRVAPELRALGFEHPSQLGATFMAGTERLRELTRDALPLVDDFPLRLSNEPFGPDEAHGSAFHRELMDVRTTRREFERSPFVARTFPAAVREATLPEFRWQAVINARLTYDGTAVGEPELLRVLTESDLVTLPLWLLGSEVDEQRIAEEAWERLERRPPRDPARARAVRARLEATLAIGALARRDYAEAADRLQRARADGQTGPRWAGLEIFALCLSGDLERAGGVARQLVRGSPEAARSDAYWEWLASAFGLPDPRG